MNGCKEALEELNRYISSLYDEKETCVSKSRELSDQIEKKQMECAELCDCAKALASDSAAVQAQIASLEENINAHQLDMAARQKEIDNLNREIEKQKKDKKVSDILKFIPIVNVGAAIYDLIAKDEEKIRSLQKEVSQISRYMEDLEKELADLQVKESQNEAEMVRVQDEIRQLEQEIQECASEAGRLKEEEVACLNQILKAQELINCLNDFERGLVTEEELAAFLKEHGYVS